MTKEEIKEQYDMDAILERYSLRKNRSGFICCPFHKGDREASMKIYKNDFYCFGCGASGDIFSFVMQMEQISFLEAFQRLGGTTEYRSDFRSRFALYRLKKQQETRALNEKHRKEELQLQSNLITTYRNAMEQADPMSDTWCDCYNALQLALYRFEILGEQR